MLPLDPGLIKERVCVLEIRSWTDAWEHFLIESERSERFSNMKCAHCGKEISPTSRFCTYCGNKVSASSAEIKTKKMKCNACGGVLSIHEDKQVLFCPYCGSKELINESGAYTFKREESSADTFRHTTSYPSHLAYNSILQYPSV